MLTQQRAPRNSNSEGARSPSLRPAPQFGVAHIDVVPGWAANASLAEAGIRLKNGPSSDGDQRRQLADAPRVEGPGQRQTPDAAQRAVRGAVRDDLCRSPGAD